MSLHMDILENKLSDQQKRFCDEYLVNFNAYRAALSAGYDENTASTAELLHLPKIQEYLQARMAQTAERVEITHDMILRELAKVAFASMGDYYDLRGQLKPMAELSESQKAAISQYQILDAVDGDGYRVGELCKIKLHNKMAALDRIARHVGFYAEKKVARGELPVAGLKEEKSLKQDAVFYSEAGNLKQEEPNSELLTVNVEGALTEPVNVGAPLMQVVNDEAVGANEASEKAEKNLTISPLVAGPRSEYQPPFGKNRALVNEKKRVVSFDRGSYTFKRSGS